ncbi:MAG: hypothetical protein ACPLN0_02580 [Candidatus Hydrothermia bacterium]
MKKFEGTIKKVLKNLGLEKGYEHKILAQELKEYLSTRYGSEYIGKIRVSGKIIIVEVKSPALRQELVMKKNELLNFLKERSESNFPEDIKFVGRL